MQELIDKIDLKFIDEYDSEVLQSLSDLRQEATNLLEKEKEQIIDAYSKGYMIGEELDMLEPSIEMSNKYYNQTYNQNK